MAEFQKHEEPNLVYVFDPQFYSKMIGKSQDSLSMLYGNSFGGYPLVNP